MRDVRERIKPGADVLIANGAVVPETHALKPGDAVVLIRRGETPSAEELEALMASRHTPGVHDRVKRATVGIAGLGGLGSAIAVALARTGVGRLVLADFDLVEPSNLNRQQYFVEQLGRPKTEALAESLRRINPYVALELHALRLTPENVPTIFRTADVLAEAFDRADQKAMLLNAFAAAFPEKPLVMASGLAGHGPGGTIRVTRFGRNVHIVGDGESAAEPGRGLMAPRVGIAAHLQANTVLRLLLGETEG
jgi:sulfur carrier protein ThiS adenylyltransferase